MTHPRDLHPASWWVWAIGVAAAGSMTTNPLLIALLICALSVVVLRRRGDHSWSRSFRLYCLLAVLIVVIRVVFRVLFGSAPGGTVLLDLPQIALPSWVLGIRLLGPLTAESLLAGLYDGLRLALVVLCFGAANSLANPKRLLKSVPQALYEVGTALVVAVTIFPQLADSARRVRRAQQLRGGAQGRISGLRRLLVPVLEDALERSMQLAAGMDTRGYGRAPGLSLRQRALTGVALLLGLGGIAFGAYAIVYQAKPLAEAAGMLVVGVGLCVLGLWLAGRRVRRTRYRASGWGPAEFAVIGCGLAAAVFGWAVSYWQPWSAFPALMVVPPVTLLGLAAAVATALPAVVTPPAPLVGEGLG